MGTPGLPIKRVAAHPVHAACRRREWGGHVTSYSYDLAGDLTGVSGVNGTFNYGYDYARNRTSMTDGNNHITGYVYDARKRLIETDYPDGTKKTNSYDGPGNLTSVVDQAGNEVDYTYDAANQLQSVVQTSSPSANNITSNSYDPLGNLIGLNDANSHLTESNFDLLSQPSSKTLPDGSLSHIFSGRGSRCLRLNGCRGDMLRAAGRL